MGTEGGQGRILARSAGWTGEELEGWKGEFQGVGAAQGAGGVSPGKERLRHLSEHRLWANAGSKKFSLLFQQGKERTRCAFHKDPSACLGDQRRQTSIPSPHERRSHWASGRKRTVSHATTASRKNTSNRDGSGMKTVCPKWPLHLIYHEILNNHSDSKAA